MESRRLSCSFMARAASSMSLKVFGLAAAVCAITALVPGSIFRTALQHGQVTSKAGAFLAMSRADDTPKMSALLAYRPFQVRSHLAQVSATVRREPGAPSERSAAERPR